MSDADVVIVLYVSSVVMNAAAIDGAPPRRISDQKEKGNVLFQALNPGRIY
jgi:hypothetical protein